MPVALGDEADAQVAAMVAGLGDEAREQLRARIAAEQDRRMSQRLFEHLFPEEDSVWTGPSILGGLIERGQTIHARRRYAKHLEFFAAGASFRERCFMAANRIGKTFSAGGYEMACHLTGRYPDWWEGRRFTQPISAWAAGARYETTRDILQLTLLGGVTHRGQRKVVDGTGVIPGDTLGTPTWRSGVQDLVDSIPVAYAGGGFSTLGFKSYDQGRKAFEGTARHVIWPDEEPPNDVYGEMLMRTATVNGLVMVTFTPLKGLSEVVMSFMPADQRPDLSK